jgi:hypothetical protein
MNIRRFNDKGLVAFRAFLDEVKADPTLSAPNHLLEDDELTEIISTKVDLSSRVLSTRMEAGTFLLDLVEKIGLSTPEKDVGFWSWMALVFFESLCPVDRAGKRKMGDKSRCILELRHDRFYRHLLLGPFLIVRAHKDNPERAVVLLSNHPSTPGDISEQFSSRLEQITNKGLVELLSKLYFDPTHNTIKRGAAGKGGGSVRRLSMLMNQLDLTYYLYGMTGEAMAALLPKEFDKFRKMTA